MKCGCITKTKTINCAELHIDARIEVGETITKPDAPILQISTDRGEVIEIHFSSPGALITFCKSHQVELVDQRVAEDAH